MWDRPFVIGNSVTVGDFVLAYTLDWANEAHLLDEYLQLRTYMQRMYARPHAPPAYRWSLRYIRCARAN